MKLRFVVTVTVNPHQMEGKPGDIVRDEITSNLQSVNYVEECEVTPIGRHVSRERCR